MPQDWCPVAPGRGCCGRRFCGAAWQTARRPSGNATHLRRFAYSPSPPLSMRVLLALLATAAVAVSAVHHPRPHSRVPASVAHAQSPRKDGAEWMSFCPSTSGLVAAAGVINGCSAYGFHDDQVTATGWSYLHVESDPTLPSDEQAYAAGFAEGYLTAARIAQSYTNTIAGGFTNGTIPTSVYTFIETQQQWVYAQYQADPTNSYWINAMFLYQQVQGLVDGCAAAQPPYVITLADALVLSMVAEAGDMQAATDLVYRESIDVLKMHDLKRVKAIMEKNSHCSALIRMSPDGQDMFSAHTTWSAFSTSGHNSHCRNLPAGLCSPSLTHACNSVLLVAVLFQYAAHLQVHQRQPDRHHGAGHSGEVKKRRERELREHYCALARAILLLALLTWFSALFVRSSSPPTLVL